MNTLLIISTCIFLIAMTSIYLNRQIIEANKKIKILGEKLIIVADIVQKDKIKNLNKSVEALGEKLEKI